MNAFLADKAFMDAFKRAPAAKALHHNYIGGLLEHIMELIALARDVARHFPGIDMDLLTVGAFLHDIGKVVLNNEFPEDFARVMERVYNDSVTFTIAEAEVFDFSQRKLGAEVVKKWGFPETLEKLLLNFDDQEEIKKEKYLYNLVTIITLADRMCQKFGLGWRKPGGEGVDFGNLPESLGLDQEEMKDLMEKIQVTFSQGIELY